MSTKFCVTSYASVGCTFIEWSLHFLSGQTQYYNVESNQWIPLSQNPMTKINAHVHRKNHPSGYNNTQLCIEKFNSLHVNAIYSIYPHKLYMDVAANQAQIPIDQFHDPKMLSQVYEFINNDYNKILQYCGEHDIPLIFVSQDPRTELYHHNVRSLERYVWKPGKPKSEQDLIDEFQEVFFKHSMKQWKELNLTEVWDVRERIALDTRPFSKLPDYKFDLQMPHHWVNCLDLWTRTENTIKRMMEYLGLEIVPDQWQAWLPICKNWQEKQLSLLEFCYNQPHIIEAIVNNWYYEIDLTFQQEVIVQHCLIYQHGLNLKTWQLKKFPSNTQDLHKLLEPNIHPVPRIY